MSSSRPVKETGWKETVLILSTFWIAKFRVSPTWSLFEPFAIVVSSLVSMAWGCWVEAVEGGVCDVEEGAELAMLVGLVADAVELQVHEAQARLGGLPGEFVVLGEADAVGRALDREVPDLLRVTDRRQEVRREG